MAEQVGVCRNCVHWERPHGRQVWSHCNRLNQAPYMILTGAHHDGPRIMTQRHFGCVMFAPKRPMERHTH